MIFFICIIISIIAIIVIYKRIQYNTTQEAFTWNLLNVGPEASDCYSLNNKQCLENSNCGLCLKENKTECIPGDEQGPFFKEDCENWAYTNFYDGHIWDDKKTTISPPWSKFYSIYEARYPSPVVVSTLR